MLKPVAFATVKATQKRYSIYNVASETVEHKVYALWVDRSGCVVSCSCPDHTFRKRTCKHMRDLQTQLSESQPQPARRVTPMRQCETWGGDDDQALYGPVPVSYPERAAAERRAAFDAVAAQVRAIEARAKTVACKRAKQFADLPLNGNAGFSLLKPAQ